MKEIVLQTTVKVCKYEELGEEDRFLVDMARNAAKSNKPSFKGLTYEYMENYISKHDDEQNTIMVRRIVP